MPHPEKIVIYTDGSCNPSHQIGAWAAIIQYGYEEIILQGKVQTTSHQRMEVEAVLQALRHLELLKVDIVTIHVHTDSQYVAGISARKEKLKNLQMSGGRNADLVAALIRYLEMWTINLIKVKAHQKKTRAINLNRTADKLSRKIVREHVRSLIPD